MDDALVEFAQFRRAREAELTEPYGWLTLRGFQWLPSTPAELPGLPGLWWADADQSSAHLTAGSSDGLLRDGEPIDGLSTLTVDEYARTPWADVADVRVELLRRGGRLAVRWRTETSPEREAFSQVPMFTYDPAWRLGGRFTPYAEAREVVVDTIRPDLQQVMHPFGEVEFTTGDRPQRLAVTKGKYGWGVEFRDPTNGELTEQWRQLHFDPPTELDTSGGGEVLLDFNRSLNMWFAFTDFATCPAPIAGNVVTVPVRAGELRVRG